MTTTVTLLTNPYATHLRAFHGDAALKSSLLAEVEKHRLADAITQGTYWTEGGGKMGGRGCAVGCSIHSLARLSGRTLDPSAHRLYEPEIGVPAPLAHLEDAIFESLPGERAQTWPSEFIAAIPVGADLSLVVPRLLLWLLDDPEDGLIAVAETEDVREAVRQVAALYRAAVAGEGVTQAQVDAAGAAARDARAARDAWDAWDAWAARAAWDARAAWAAWAARDAWDARAARDAWDAWAAWAARDAWDARAAWAARAARAAWAAWAARAARAAWAARDARAAWAARAARDARDARAARDARDARDAWAVTSADKLLALLSEAPVPPAASRIPPAEDPYEAQTTVVAMQASPAKSPKKGAAE